MHLDICASALLLLLLTLPAWAHDDPPNSGNPPSDPGRTNAVIIQSRPGQNAWNAGQPPADWWAEIKRQHGHVGPWNVLGWRIGQAALREYGAAWGRHDLEIICYVPTQTPFTCLVDGLSVGTGNSLGRLDLRLAEVFDYRQIFIAVRSKALNRDTLEFRPQPDYLRSIINQKLEDLERLSRECITLPEEQLFSIRRYPPAVVAGEAHQARLR
jgi:formylmethanofuran dehydrogenase subunit E